MKKKLRAYPILCCVILFAICFAAQLVECLWIKTDQTIIGENFINKVFGIILLALLLQMLSWKWKDIGFLPKKALQYILCGIAIGTVFFAVAYFAEMMLLIAQGQAPHLEIFVSGFSLTGTEVRHTGINYILMCTFFNLINVWMEEGTFRGLYPKLIEEKHSEGKAILISALMFGFWHLSLPIQSYVDGSMTLELAVAMSVGYLVLAGMMSIKWSMLKKMTGSIWMGLGDHLFNNLVATNLLHVISVSGTDSLMIVRILLAQTLSFGCVLLVYRKRSKTVR